MGLINRTCNRCIGKGHKIVRGKQEFCQVCKGVGFIQVSEDETTKP